MGFYSLFCGGKGFIEPSPEGRRHDAAVSHKRIDLNGLLFAGDIVESSINACGYAGGIDQSHSKVGFPFDAFCKISSIKVGGGLKMEREVGLPFFWGMSLGQPASLPLPARKPVWSQRAGTKE